MTQHLTKRAVLGFVLCAALGLSDFFTLGLIGVEMTMRGDDITMWVVALFALNFGVLGFVIGRLMDKRDETRSQADVIRTQYDALEAAQQQLVETEKLAAVGRLASGVAHEVRNPLGVIRSSAQMVIEDLEPGSESREAAEFIQEEVDRLNAFVTKLLDFTRPLKPSPEPMSIQALAASLQSSFAPTCAERDIELAVELDEGRELVADRTLLAQLLHGLVTNAVQAVAPGGRVAVRAEPSGEDWVVEVADDGPGVEAQGRAQVFEPFFTTKAGGTGLGLAMARKIAEVHGGTLELVDGRGLGPEGRGACFRLRLAA